MPDSRHRRRTLAALAAAAAVFAAAALAAGYIGGKTVVVTARKLHGQTAHVLTTQDGITLYYSTEDTPEKSTCTGACTKTWKPFALVGLGRPTASEKLRPHLSILQRSQQSFQVEYNGHPLYTYVKDREPGDMRGAGKDPFRVATLATPSASTGGATR